MAKCGFCDYISKGRGLFAHQWAEHKEQMTERRLKGLAKRHGKDMSADGITVTAEDTSSLSDQPSGNNVKNPKSQKKTDKPVILSGTRPTGNIADAVSIVISPRTFSMSSSMLWRAMEAAKRYWGWPAAMTPEDFLDTYLSISYRQRGIVLDGFELLQAQTPDFVTDNGNGHNGHNGNGHKEEVATSVEYGQVQQEELESVASNSF